MWFPVEAPEGYVAVVARRHVNWMLLGKKFEDELYVFVDSLLDKPNTSMAYVVEWAEKRALDKRVGVEATCKRIPGWKTPWWELEAFRDELANDESEPDEDLPEVENDDEYDEYDEDDC